MNLPGDPNDARFDHVESVLNHLSNSQRHLMTAQVLMNNLTKADRLIERVAEQLNVITRNLQNLDAKLDKFAEQIQIHADGQKHRDARIGRCATS